MEKTDPLQSYDADQEFKEMVRYFYENKGDPTRYSGWDAERCQRLMPGFFTAWTHARLYERMANVLVKEEAPDDY